MQSEKTGSARERILARLTVHVNRLATPDSLPALPRWALTSIEERTQHFKQKLAEEGIKSYVIQHANMITAIIRLIKGRQTEGVLIGSHGLGNNDDIQAEFTKHDISWKLWDEHTNPAIHATQWSGVVHAQAGIAETGSLLLWHDAQQPHVISTAVKHLVVLIKRSLIKNQFLELVEGVEWMQPPPTISLFTGLGRNTILGVDAQLANIGPRMVDVIILNDVEVPTAPPANIPIAQAPDLTLL